MRKILSIGLLIVGFAIFNSCKKDASSEQYTPTPNKPTIPDLTSTITTSVSGFIIDERDSAVSGAQVTGGTQTVTTNQFGYFKISDASLLKTAAFIKVTMNGYFNGYRTFIAQQGKETFMRLQLIPKTAIGTINAVTGGTLSTTDGATVTLPSNAVIVFSNGNAYTGTIHVAAHWINPSGNDLQQTMPGNLLGIDTAGYLKVLATFGMLAVELTDDGGNLLQIATGKQATLSFPIPSGLGASAPATIPLWSFTETNGLWKQESSATKTGNNYVGNVSHFSYWNCDIGMGLVNFKVQIVDSSLHPLANVAVALSITSPYNSTRVAYTDTAGFVYGKIPANTDIKLNLLSDCNITAFTKSFTATGNDVDLGGIVANVANNEFIITGSAVSCNNSPITNGAAIIYGNGISKIVSILNGTFNTYTLGCATTVPVNIAILDSANNLQSASQNIQLTPGINNLGTISACSISTNEYLTISIDGGNPITSSTVYTGATSQSYAAHYDTLGIDDSVNLILCYFGNFSDNTVIGMYLPFYGTATIGSHPTYVWKTTGGDSTRIMTQAFGTFRTPTPYATTVNITEYGNVNEYIAGNFTALFHYKDSLPEDHTILCSFRVKRTQ